MADRKNDNPSISRYGFATTHWSIVLAAKGDDTDSLAALQTLCETYYEPVRGYIEKTLSRGENQNELARELAHDFFAKLLKRDQLQNLQQQRGRFRVYLLGAVKHFLADHWDHEHALKRGGDETVIPLEACADDISGKNGFPPDAYFDRQWGVTLVQTVLEQMRSEAAAKGELERFEQLKPFLETSGKARPDDAAMRVAIHRFRQKYRKLILEQVAGTVDTPEEVDAELDYLIQTLMQTQ